ncbi:hypothetical protein AB0O16_16390 [Microbacterium sp. NPDC089180]|uniref:hypothetical protein n=1 Tax=unclassified Microbacterium TaxID=2609290 RepID=UPI00344733B4
MPLISLSVDEVRRAATKVKEVSAGLSPLPLLSVPGQPDLSLALAEFVACLNDCRSEREREIDATAAGLRDVADLFEGTETAAVEGIRSLASAAGWSLP